jgi:hypothetical protein
LLNAAVRAGGHLQAVAPRGNKPFKQELQQNKKKVHRPHRPFWAHRVNQTRRFSFRLPQPKSPSRPNSEFSINLCLRSAFAPQPQAPIVMNLF